MFWQPTATLEPFAAAITVGSSTGDGNRAISSRVWPATSGKKASTNALASAGVLYIFQLAAISFLRDILYGFLRVILTDRSEPTGDPEHMSAAEQDMQPIGCGMAPPSILWMEAPCIQRVKGGR